MVEYTSMLKWMLTASMVLLLWGGVAWAEYPKPSPFPVSWELKFTHGKPTRVVVRVPGSDVPRAFWYMTYSLTNPITNNSTMDKERDFYPVFEMLTEDGKVVRSDDNILPAVFDEIKAREGNQFLENSNHMYGEIKLGSDQSRDGVAIWPEPAVRMGTFTIFVSGIYGETSDVKDTDGKTVTLRKTTELDFHINGDASFAPGTVVDQVATDSIMR
jgi:hypothetical protein